MKKKEDKISYYWDSIIEEFITMRDPSIKNILGYIDPNNINVEQALRVLAKENRFSRRMLSQTFLEFYRNIDTESRFCNSKNGIFYVFLKKSVNYDRIERQKELFIRCLIVRHKINRNAVIIGIATENDISIGHSYDLIFYENTNWTTQDDHFAEKAISELGYFSKPLFKHSHFDEFPKT